MSNNFRQENGHEWPTLLRASTLAREDQSQAPAAPGLDLQRRAQRAIEHGAWCKWENCPQPDKP